MTPDTIIIHASDTNVMLDTTSEKLFKMKKYDMGWYKRIGYHFYVRKDGEVEKHRDIFDHGLHCCGWNQHSIAICYEGGEEGIHKRLDTRTDAQKEAIIKLIEDIVSECSSIKVIMGYGQCSNIPSLNPYFDARAEYMPILKRFKDKFYGKV